MSKRDRLMECFDIAMDYVQKYMAVKIGLPNGKYEVIIFERNAFVDKRTYYMNNYDEDLKLKRTPEIEILDFCCANDYESIEVELIGE